MSPSGHRAYAWRGNPVSSQGTPSITLMFAGITGVEGLSGAFGVSFLFGVEGLALMALDVSVRFPLDVFGFLQFADFEL